MTEAMTFGPDRDLGSARPTTFNSISSLFTNTLARQLWSKRALVFALLYLLPIALAILIREVSPGLHGMAAYEPAFAEFVLLFNLLPQVYIPLTALVFASGMIQDEIEDQTITFLLIRPLPRWSIYAAKLAATLLGSIVLTAAATAVIFVVIGWGQPDYWGSGGGFSRMGKVIALYALSLTAYHAIFGLLSLLMRKAILLGVAYIILLEGWVAIIDFVIRKGTVMYHFRILSERWIGLGRADDYNLNLPEAPTLQTSVLILLGTSVVTSILAMLLMSTREFRVKTPEGS